LEDKDASSPTTWVSLLSAFPQSLVHDPYTLTFHTGLGKTLQSVTLIYTLLKTGITANGECTAKRVIVVCPCSLVKNWENEFTKWLGPGTVKALALAESDRKTVEKNIDIFVRTKVRIRTRQTMISSHCATSSQ
jgi:SNF2 family DNA or RNA helicase